MHKHFDLADTLKVAELRTLDESELAQTEGGFWVTPDGADGMPGYDPKDYATDPRLITY